MSYVFISYSHENVGYANYFKDELIKQGFNIWMDSISIKGGDDWWSSIRRGIEQCAAFTLIMTPQAESSEYVQNELMYAQQLKKPFFPLLLEGDANPVNSDVWSRFGRIQAIDVRNAQLPTNKFFTDLSEYLPRSSHAADVTPLQPQSGTVSQNIAPSPSSAPISAVAIPLITVEDIMTDPFAWCTIPAGDVTLIYKNDERHKDTVPEFQIAKYPITNKQFVKFITERGYSEKNYWTDAGWMIAQKGNQKGPWDKPENFRSKDGRIADNPIVGVSWFEAMAFCKWLSKKSGQNITLPTEQQWQRAAQGDDDRNYPWEGKFKSRYCNSNSTKTTSVKKYEDDGKSPFGVADMSGNVWEWCLTQFQSGGTDKEGQNDRVIRGGSWRDSNNYKFQVNFRDRNSPDTREVNIGFRIARLITG